MKIGIDHHPARVRWHGVGRYSRELVRALLRIQDAPEIALSDVGREKRTIGEPALGLADAPRKPRVKSSTQGRKMFSMLKRSADGMLGDVDVYHRMLPDWPPVAKAREVIGVAELFEPGSERDAHLADCLKRAHAIVFSNATAARLTDRYGLPADRIHRTPVGSDHWLRDLAAMPKPPARRDPPQIVVLGAIHPNRRPERVLAAIVALRRKRLKPNVLYIGPRTDASDGFLRDELGSSVARDQILWNPNTVESDMARILASSSALIHLTAGEETAVTPLEGLAFGLPTIASRIAPFEEDVEGAARLLSPEEEEDPTAMAEILAEALEGDSEEAQAKRREHAAGFTWAKNAESTVEVYRAIAAS